MRVTFLGTGSAVPTPTRNVSALALRLPQRGGWWLFDCGEGTQHQILRSELTLGRLERIFITHMHGDHVFGLPGLLASRSLGGGPASRVTLHGPSELEEYVSSALRCSRTRLNYELVVEKAAPGRILEDHGAVVEAFPVKHGAEAFAFAIIEKDLPGRLDAERAKALGVPDGPLLGRLKRGETVELADGRKVDGRELIGPLRRGRKIVVTGDTGLTPGFAEFAAGADLLIHEATYLDADQALATQREHSTAGEAAGTARSAGAKTLILTHLSPRYEQDVGVDAFLAEARLTFPETLLARDLWTYEVRRGDRGGD